VVTCWHGATHSPPQNLTLGAVITGLDGRRWAYTGEAYGGMGSKFKIDEPRQSSQPAAVPAAAITLARLGDRPPPPPDHLPAGLRLEYSSTQWTEWEDGTRTGRDGQPKAKGERPRYRDAAGEVHYLAGDDPWPLFGAATVPQARGQWIAAAEGPKCALWLQAGGLVAVSQPGHDHKDPSIRRRFEGLQAAGVIGMVYLANKLASQRVV